jgi:hygromycin-B 4-O-kinase
MDPSPVDAAPDVLARAIVSELTGRRVSSVHPLRGENVATAFRVRSGGGDLVVRLVQGIPDAFAADQAIAGLLAGSTIPVPQLLMTAERAGWQYAVSAFAPGEMADRLGAAAAERLAPELLRVMAAIHGVDVSRTTGFGAIGPDGNGGQAGWREAIVHVFDERQTGYWHGWRSQLAYSRLDWHLFDRADTALRSLLEHCPERRWLVHGDFGFSNVLVEDGRITAVLDWSNARFGDFLWDVAWLGFFTDDLDLRARLRPARVSGPKADERLSCYQVAIGMDALRFYARADDAAAYDWATRRLSDVLASLPGR